MFLKSKDIIFSVIGALVLLFLASSLLANPTLLQKKPEKKEKLREEELVIKDVKVDELIINQFINLELVKSIFPEATSYGKIDKDTKENANSPQQNGHPQICWLICLLLAPTKYDG